jgi:hypothetical protein
MPCNEKTTMKPDGSKIVRKEHIDPTTGKCYKIEITEYPSSAPDFSVMSSINKKPKTTVIYPEDTSEQDAGFHSTLMPVIGKTTVGKTTVKTVETKSVPAPMAKPLKVDVPTIQKAPIASSPPPPQVDSNNNNSNGSPSAAGGGGGGGGGSGTAVDAGKGGCCIIQ